MSSSQRLDPEETGIEQAGTKDSAAERGAPTLGRGGVLGIWLGINAWLLGPLFLVLRTGDGTLFLDVLLPGTFLSLGLAGTCHLLLLGVESLCPGDRGIRTFTLMGSMWLTMGLLYLLVSRLFLPVIETNEAGLELLDITGSATSDVMTAPAVIMLAVGCGMLIGVLRRVGKTP